MFNIDLEGEENNIQDCYTALYVTCSGTVKEGKTLELVFLLFTYEGSMVSSLT